MEKDIAILAACIVIGTWLTTVFVALKNLSWGGIKKLDSKKEKELIFKAEQWLEKRNSYRITLRLLVLINIAFMAIVSMQIAVEHCKLKIDDYPTKLLLTVGVTYIFVLITESVSILFINKSWLVLRTSMPVVRLLHLIPAFFTYPAVRLHNRLENRETDDDDDKARMEDEIEALLDQDAYSNSDDDEKSGLEENTGRMIRGILDLDETLVKEIMTPRVDVVGASLSTSIKDLRKTIVDSGHSRIPVYETNIDDIKGVVYSKNMLDDETVNANSELKDIMHDAIYIPETKNVNQLLKEFKQNKVHIAVVLDEYGGTAGIVTLEDILEEIVGEIADEFDSAEEEDPKLQISDDGWLELDGRCELEDAYEALDIHLEEDEGNVTIGGLVITHLGRIPKSGEQVELDELIADILEADERRVTKLRIRKPDSKTDGKDKNRQGA